MSVLVDLTGKRFGRLTVLYREGTYQRPSGNKEPTWRCVCECGKEVIVLSSNLKKGNTTSCGCVQSENRFSARRETEYEVRDDVAYVKSFDGVEFLINTCDIENVISHRWHSNKYGYMADEHGNTVHRTLMNPPTAMDVHHINGNKLDNRRSNLLMMTRAEHTSLHQKERYANGVTVQRWIPVTERLPDKGVIVLVSDGSDYPETAELVLRNSGRLIWEDGYFREAKYITHWMPIPPAPKEGNMSQKVPSYYEPVELENKNNTNPTKTNADRIRGMSDEELAKHLLHIGWDCHLCEEHERLDNNPWLHGEKCDEKCVDHCLEWLQQPPKEE